MKLKPNDPNKKRWHNLNILNDFQQHCKDIDVYDMRILLCLFRHGDKKDRASIGMRRGAKECGIALSTWVERTKKMKKMGKRGLMRSGMPGMMPPGMPPGPGMR